MMSNYSPIERAIARTLSRFPFIKQLAKSTYSRLMYVRNKKPYKSQAISSPNIIASSSYSSFFGYYDKPPENSKGLVLSCSTDANTSKLPALNQEIELCVFNQQGDVLVQVPVNAHNWQQGCRAQWLDDDLFIYNDFDRDAKAYISRVYSVSDRREVRTFSYPVQDSFKRDYFISLNYQRLMTLRPDYGYRNLPNLDAATLADLKSDGLWKIDFATGEATLFISIADACRLKHDDAFGSAVHKLNHVIISPDGSQFIFMHRFLVDGQRFDRLIVANSETAEMRLLADYGMVSHCFWADNETVLGYLRGPNGKDGYWLLNVNSSEFKELPCSELEKYGDGHPHVHGDWFITDTYPDKARMQHLLWCNWKTGEVKHVGEFFHGLEFNGESRCDLHPRLSPDGKSVYFDSVFSGQRQLYKMDLPV